MEATWNTWHHVAIAVSILSHLNRNALSTVSPDATLTSDALNKGGFLNT